MGGCCASKHVASSSGPKKPPLPEAGPQQRPAEGEPPLSPSSVQIAVSTWTDENPSGYLRFVEADEDLLGDLQRLKYRLAEYDPALAAAFGTDELNDLQHALLHEAAAVEKQERAAERRAAVQPTTSSASVLSSSSSSRAPGRVHRYLFLDAGAAASNGAARLQACLERFSGIKVEEKACLELIGSLRRGRTGLTVFNLLETLHFVRTSGPLAEFVKHRIADLTRFEELCLPNFHPETINFFGEETLFDVWRGWYSTGEETRGPVAAAAVLVDGGVESAEDEGRGDRVLADAGELQRLLSRFRWEDSFLRERGTAEAALAGRGGTIDLLSFCRLVVELQAKSEER